MNLFIESHQQWIKNLIDADVDFIVVGGYSVIFHGYRRTTGDVDIWLKPDNANKEKILPVLYKAGFDEDDVRQIAGFDFTKHLVFTVGEAPEKIDFLTNINLVSYEEADKQKIIAEADGLNIPFLHLNHLVLSKINTGRAKDQADVEMLQQVDKARKSNG
jgi:hypothetical protein